MRDIRSALSFIITCNLNCNSIQEKAFEKQPFFDIADHFYYNSIFTAKDELLKEFAEIDPSKTSMPQIDRQLAILYSQDKIQQTDTLFPLSNVKKEIDTNEGNPEKWMVYFRRRLFFEGKEDMFEDNLKGVRKARELLPYRHLKLFIQHLNKKGNREKLRECLSRGISQMEGIRDTDISMCTKGFAGIRTIFLFKFKTSVHRLFCKE